MHWDRFGSPSRTLCPKVVGSIPTGPTGKKRRFHRVFCGAFASQHRNSVGESPQKARMWPRSSVRVTRSPMNLYSFTGDLDLSMN